MGATEAGRPRRGGGALALAGALAILTFAPSQAVAASPTLGPAWAGEVVATSARLHTDVDPNGLITFYRFEYITNAAYEANLKAAKAGFSGAAAVPSGAEPSVGAGNAPIAVAQQVTGLAPETSYRYRAVAHSSGGTVMSDAHKITTQAFAAATILLDGRGWEMVSPAEKNGGEVAAPETLAGGGVLQAAAGGSAATFSSATSFGPEAQGAPQGSQYISRRTPSGWATENITAPMLSGSYGSGPVGVPYRLFAADLSEGLMLNGEHCRGAGDGCPVANPPLPGSGAPTGYQTLYLRNSSSGAFVSLLTSSQLTHTALDSSHLDIGFAGASDDLSQVVLSSCAALSANATEVPQGEDCDPEAQNLYRYAGGALTLINLLPAQSAGSPGATLGAQSGAIATNGSRVYWRDEETGDLYLREGSTTKLVGEAASFQAASTDGSVAFFTKSGHLYRYEATPNTATDLTPAGEVEGVLGSSADGSYLYYLTSSGLFLRHGGSVAEVAAGADESSYPPATGTARVSADGTRLAFLSSAQLGEYDNTDQETGGPDAELYLYEAPTDTLLCVSCNPTGARPLGGASLPGAIGNGTQSGSPYLYKPRAMVLEGRRLFFDSSDALVLGDSNNAKDAYEWEAQGTGGCTRLGGCLGLLSSGKAATGASFVDASADGNDAFFLTLSSLVPTDPGSQDLYDARVGGGFPPPTTPIPCEGDACQPLEPEPEDHTITTLIPGPGNPAVRYPHHTRKHRKKAAHRRHDKRQGRNHRRTGR